MQMLPSGQVENLLSKESNLENLNNFKEILKKFYYDSDSQKRILKAIGTRQIIDNRFQLDSDKRIFFEIKHNRDTDLAYGKYKNLISSLPRSIDNDELMDLYHYKTFQTGKITINKQKHKLFRYLKNKYKVEKDLIEPITTIKNNQKLYFCISRNPIDYLFCATGQNFGSCLSLDSDHDAALYMGLPGLTLDTNRMISFITNGKFKTYEVKNLTFKHFKMLSRNWLLWGNQYSPKLTECIAEIKYYPNKKIDFAPLIKKYYHVNIYTDEHGFTSQNSFQVAKYENGDNSGIFYDEPIGIVKTVHGYHYSSYGSERRMRDYFVPDFDWEDGFDSIECFDDLRVNSKRCDICGKADDFKNIKGEQYCEECFNERFFYCDNCHDVTDLDYSQNAQNGGQYCEECFEEEYTYCSECGDVVDLSAAQLNNDGDPYCEGCFEDMYVSCSKCGTIVEENDCEENDCGDTFCGNCFNAKYSNCSVCDDLIEKNDCYKIGNKMYCEDCYENLQQE